MSFNLKETTQRHEAARQGLSKLAHVIGEQRIGTGSAGVYQHINPTTGQVQAEVPLGGQREIDAAIAAARAAFPAWRATPPAQRRDMLQRLAQLVKDRTEDFANSAALEIGMSKLFAAGMVGMTHDWIAYYAGWADKITGEVTSTSPDEFTYTLPEPYGVIAAIVTWNGPLISFAMKVVPALAAGNVVVVKPAEFTPFVAQLFVELCLEAGIPPGVVNLVHGAGEAGTALTSHPGVDKITFTGGAVTAHRILEAAAHTLRPAVLELGGKSANLLFADADMAQVIPYSVTMAMFLSGQGCAFPTRLLVEQSVYDQTVAAVLQTVAGLTQGDPMLETIFMGPLVNASAVQRVTGMIDRAKAQKAGKLACGGARPDGEMAAGCFVQPTVFVDVDPASELAMKEVFGPVLSIIPFSSEEEAIRIANSTEYGLAAYVQTRDAARIKRLTSALRAGTVAVNGAVPLLPHAPFGGLGISGFGKEGGKAGLDEFIFQKTVVTRG